MKAEIINCGSCNLYSVYNWLRTSQLFETINISTDASETCVSDIVFLPGVGSYKQLYANLLSTHYDSYLTDLRKRGIWIVGICLGAQIMLQGSEEDDCFSQGLNWFEGHVFKAPTVFRPLTGWYLSEPEFSPTIDVSGHYYHNHNYIMKPVNDEYIISKLSHTGICSCIKQDNVVGIQFHPEKSQDRGQRLLESIVKRVKS
ncbi:imidazole glycerol phosphate synthase subunit HisH [bacterium]|nr:imidazole glycerol phosphate synthase subunit HisH [bacterium]